MEELRAVGIFSKAAVLRAARWLHIDGIEGFRTQTAQESGRVERASPHFHVVALLNNASLLSPKGCQLANDLLKSQHRQ